MWLTGLRGMDLMPDLWSGLYRRRPEAGRFFPGAGASYYPNFPAVNLWMADEDVIVTAEIPGIDMEAIDISVEGDMLTLSGSRQLETPGSEGRYHRQERPHGNFRRKIRIPFRIDADRVDARYERGVLVIRLPRSEDDKPKKIAIKSD